MGRLLQYRFPGASPAVDARDRSVAAPLGPVSRDPETPPAGLGGHAVGNLLLAALVQLEQGDFEEAVREMNRVLAVRGRVVPATGTVITLMRGARRRDPGRPGRAGSPGPTASTASGSRPRTSTRRDDALQAIADAELIVIGPGSLFTSLLPALVVPGIREAIAASGALVVFVCNVATQPGETGGFDLADHIDALSRHGAAQLPDIVLANNRFDAHAPSGWLGQPVQLRWPPTKSPGIRGSSSTTSWTPRTPTTTIRLASPPPSCGAWEREGGHRRRPREARADRTA